MPCKNLSAARMTRALDASGLLKKYMVYSQPVNADGVPDGDMEIICTVRGYHYKKRYSGVNLSVDIPGHINTSDRRNLYMFIPITCRKNYDAITAGMVVKINDALLEIVEIESNAGVSITLKLG